MNILRNILAVISGYALFVISTVLLFQLSDIDPHADPSLNTIVLTIGYGLLLSFISGMIAQFISKSRKLIVNYALAGIIAGFATFSLLKASGNYYSQLAAIFLFAPASIVGGLTYLKKIRK